MLIAVHGNLGSGKTLLMVIFGYLTNKHVYANFNISYPNKDVKEFTLQTIKSKSVSNALVLLDEIYTLVESRTPHSDLNRIMTYILFQSRKKDLDIMVTAQLLRTVDVRFREMIDYTIECERVEKYFKYTIMNNKDGVFTFYLSFERAQEFFKMYNTNEIVTSKKIDNVVDNLMNDEEKNELIELVKNELKKIECKKLNTEIINYILIKLKKDVNTKLTREIYLRIKYDEDKNEHDNRGCNRATNNRRDVSNRN